MSEPMPSLEMWPMVWAQWPSERPLPTPEQWAEAEARFFEENVRFRNQAEAEGHPYMGDCGYSLSFDMATVARELWWHHFFPDEDLRSEFQKRIAEVCRDPKEGK
jgi:hypothetical protein